MINYISSYLTVHSNSRFCFCLHLFDPLRRSCKYSLLIPDICHTVVLDDFSSPFREVGEGLEARKDRLGKESVVAERVNAKDEGRRKSLVTISLPLPSS